jgi:hypothetical protein
MSDSGRQSEPNRQSKRVARPAGRTQFIDWYSKGESRVFEFNGVSVTVRWVDRNGRKCRIAIMGPEGSVSG